MTKLFSFRALAYATFTVVLLFCLFAVMQFVRYAGRFDFQFLVMEKFSVYAFGHFPGFSVWLEDIYPRIGSFRMGVSTFGGVVDLLPGGSFHQLPDNIPKQIGVGYSTNIDMMYADVIEDFGLTGGILFYLALGSLSGYLMRRVFEGRLFGVPLLALMYSTILWSFVTSIMNYTSVFLAFAAMQMCVYFLERSVRFKRLESMEVDGLSRRRGQEARVNRNRV